MKRFEKGSAEAKAYMASIRGMKKNSADTPKKKVPARARMMKGSDEAKKCMDDLRKMKMSKKMMK